MKEKAIVLLSGGLNSAVAMAWAKERYDCIALGIYYQQRHFKEVKQAERLAMGWEIPFYFLIVEIPGTSNLTKQKGSINKKKKGLPASFVPGRNLIFLGLAASLAYSEEATRIVGGWNCIDYSGYPDCRPTFLRQTEDAINLALGYTYKEARITVKAPLLELNKKEIIQMGLKLEVPFELTWSCYEGEEKPCGKCGSCLFREKGFKEAGVKDPALEEVEHLYFKTRREEI